MLSTTQRDDQIDAAVAVPFRIDEQCTRGVRDIFAACRARFERVAFHLRVVIEHEAGILLLEVAPIVTAAEHHEIVVAQAVGDGLAVVALQEREHGFIRRIDPRVTLRVEKLRLDGEVLDITGRRIIRNLRGEHRGLARIVRARGFTQLRENAVVG